MLFFSFIKFDTDTNNQKRAIFLINLKLNKSKIFFLKQLTKRFLNYHSVYAFIIVEHILVLVHSKEKITTFL